MHDLLLNAMHTKYPADPCILNALSVAIDDFFTSGVLDKRSIDDDPPLDPRSLGLDPRFSLKCGKKCKKLLRKVVGTVVEVLTAPVVTRPVCGVAGAAAGVFTGTEEVGYLAYFVCMDQARQERERNEKREKFVKLRSSVRKPKGDELGPVMDMSPDGEPWNMMV